MGIFINPGNEAFHIIRNGRYVDKSGMIALLNQRLDTPQRMVCVSRPRRFGKSFAAKMLCAYYDAGCDSKTLFRGLEIERDPGFAEHINSLHVIYIDVTYFISNARDIHTVVDDIQTELLIEIKEEFPDISLPEDAGLAKALVLTSQKSKRKWFVIIDEWDALFREAAGSDALQKQFIYFLRGLFKGGIASDLSIAGAYMTGILPIKKYGTESALTDFEEYSMISAGPFASYVGFAETEVQQLCRSSKLDMEELKSWYDGYYLNGKAQIYSPNSVMKAVTNASCQNYWTISETYEALKQYISRDFDGLKAAVTGMLGGGRVKINSRRFQNDFASVNTRDDVLTLLVHLGYLTYDQDSCRVWIPNLEVADSFQDAVDGEAWKEIEQLLNASDQLMKHTLRKDAAYVAEEMDAVHRNTASLLKYNDDNALACAIQIAYYTARKDYRIIRELPSGNGFADICFLPLRRSDLPAVIVELKYDRDAETAIRQIKEKRYDGMLKSYFGKLLLVGINYDKKTKKHTCIIETAADTGIVPGG